MDPVQRANEPTMAELVEAVRERVERTSDAPLGSFEARVVRNVLLIVERELDLGPAAAFAHRQRLAGFGATDDRELAAAIRSGEHDARFAELCDVLLKSAEDRLRINNPRWLA